MRALLILLLTVCLYSPLAAEPTSIRILPAGTCVQVDTFAMGRPGMLAAVACLHERRACRLELQAATYPLIVKPPTIIDNGLPWWVIPVSGAGGAAIGILLGLSL